MSSAGPHSATGINLFDTWRSNDIPHVFDFRATRLNCVEIIKGIQARIDTHL